MGPEDPAKDPSRRVRALMEVAAQGSSTEEMLELFYAEIRQLAGRYLAGERDDHTLQPTALVHEAYLRLLGDREMLWESRKQFLSAAARAMRRYLVDHARGKLRAKRGGGWQRVDVTLQVGGEEAIQSDLVDLDRALEELTALFEREARVVELRYFAGLGMAQVAEILGVTQRTVERDWRHARAWLFERLGGRGGGDAAGGRSDASGPDEGL